MDELEKLKREKFKAECKGKWKEVAALCNYIGQLFSRAGNSEDALGAHREELTISEKLGDQLDIAIANRRIGECYIEMGEYKKALRHVKKYLELSVSVGSLVEQQRAWATLGRAFYYIVETGDSSVLDKTENSFIKSLELCEKLKEELPAKEYAEMKARLLLNLGLVYNKRDNISQCAESIKQAIFLAKKHSLNEDLHRCQYSLASVYEKHGDPLFALKLMDEAVNTAKTLRDKALICETFLAKAQIMVSLKDFQGARLFTKKAYKMQTPVESDQLLAEKRLKILYYICNIEAELSVLVESNHKKASLLEKIGDGLVALGCYNHAVDYYILTLESLQKMGKSEKQLGAIYFSIAQTYADFGQNDKALEYFQKELKANTGNNKEQCKTLLKIADLLEQKQNSSELEIIYQKALVAAEKCNDVNLQYQCLDRMKNFQEKNRHTTDTTEILKKLTNIAESGKLSNEDSECEEAIDIFDELSLSCMSDCSESDAEEELCDLPKRRSKRKLDSKRNDVGETPLHRACIDGNLGMVKRLIENGHTLNPRDNCGWIPLHEACNYGYYEIVKYLLEHGAWINDRGGEMCDGVTPLHDAASCGHIDVMQLLIDKGASVASRTNSGDTVLDCLKHWRERAEDLDSCELQKTIAFEAQLANMLKNCGHAEYDLYLSQELPCTSKLNRSSELTFQQRKIADKRQRSPSTSPIINHQDDSDDNGMEGNIDEYLLPMPSKLFDKNIDAPNVACCEYQSVMSKLRKSGTTFKCQNQELKKNESATALVDENEFLPVQDWLIDDVKQDKHTSKKKKIFDCIFRQNKVNQSFTSVKKNKTRTRQLKLPRMETFRSTSTLNNVEVDNAAEEWWQEASENTDECDKYKSLVEESPKIAENQTFCLKVRVENKLILVPVNNPDNTISWLSEETAKRYYDLIGMKPCLSLCTTDGAFLSSTDAIGLVLKSGDEVSATVESWNMPPLSVRYQESCIKLGTKQHSAFTQKLQLTESSGELIIENIGLVSPRVIKPVVSAVQHEKNLRILNVNGCYLSEEIIELLAISLTTLPNLVVLTLRCCGLTNTGMQVIVDTCFSNNLEHKSLQTLEKLDIAYNSIGPNFTQLSSFIQHCSLLASINLSGCEIRSSTFQNPSLRQLLKRKPNLQELYLAENQLRISGLAELFSCLCVDTLTVLDLSCTTNCGDRNFGKLFLKYFSKPYLLLLHLSMRGCHLENRDIAAIAEIISLCQNLHTLDISANPGITTTSLNILLQALNQSNVPLNCLHLAGSISWNYDGLAESCFLLAQKLSNLTLTYESTSGNVVSHLNEAWHNVHGKLSLCIEGPGNFVEFKLANLF